MNVRRSWLRIVSAATLSMLVSAGPISLRAADEKPAVKSEAGAEKKPGKKSPADYRGPLPFYYGKVIAPDQKEKIYDIQAKYEAELSALQKQGKELLAKRDAEIDAVLTPEQREKVAAMRAEAKTKTPPGKKPAKSESGAKSAEAKSEKTEKAEPTKSGD